MHVKLSFCNAHCGYDSFSYKYSIFRKNRNFQFKSDWFRNMHLMDTCKKRRMYLNRKLLRMFNF